MTFFLNLATSSPRSKSALSERTEDMDMFGAVLMVCDGV